MQKEQVLGIIRHVLTFTGGIAVTQGVATETTIVEIIGGIVAIIGGVWSIINKNKVKTD
jgi:hypothetical protein